MHELSIALSIVEIAEEEVRNAKGNKVEEVWLELGELTGIDKEALYFAWSEATKNTLLEKSALTIEVKEGIAQCLNCECKFKTSQLYDLCPFCLDFRKNLIEGNETKIKYLIII